MAELFCSNTEQPAKPLLPPTQQASQNTDFACFMESVHTHDPYQPVNSPPSQINKSEWLQGEHYVTLLYF